eukprot:352966-Chlamydomonas_euryale.AAC.4
MKPKPAGSACQPASMQGECGVCRGGGGRGGAVEGSVKPGSNSELGIAALIDCGNHTTFAAAPSHPCASPGHPCNHPTNRPGHPCNHPTNRPLPKRPLKRPTTHQAAQATKQTTEQPSNAPQLLLSTPEHGRLDRLRQQQHARRRCLPYDA